MPELIHSVEIAAPPSAVFPLLSLPEGLAKWWAEDVVPVDGGAELGFFSRATIYRLRALTLVPPTTAAWLCETGQEWEGTRIVFHIAPKTGMTDLRFRHEGWRAVSPFFVACNTTWGALLFRLKGAAEGGAPGPLFTREGLASGTKGP